MRDTLNGRVGDGGRPTGASVGPRGLLGKSASTSAIDSHVGRRSRFQVGQGPLSLAVGVDDERLSLLRAGRSPAWCRG